MANGVRGEAYTSIIDLTAAYMLMFAMPALSIVDLVLRENGLSNMRETPNTSHDICHEITTWSRTLKSPEHVWQTLVIIHFYRNPARGNVRMNKQHMQALKQEANVPS
jgi:hypothetical protein